VIGAVVGRAVGLLAVWDGWMDSLLRSQFSQWKNSGWAGQLVSWSVVSGQWSESERPKTVTPEKSLPGKN
jgi:hypothetical protein